MTVGIYVPTLGRPHALQRVVDNVRETTSVPFAVVFVVEPHDTESLYAARATRAVTLTNRYAASYSNAFQTAYEMRDDEFMLNGNDDFDFQPGWDDALNEFKPGVDVVGVYDGKSGHSAIHLIRRAYIQQRSGVVDIPNRVFFPYRHNYVDTEMTDTARARGVWAFSTEGEIRHMHPAWGFAANDATYEKSAATMDEDGRTFRGREHLWSA